MISPNEFLFCNDDAEMIQAAVDKAAACGETVHIPAKNARTGANLWVISRAILLPGGSTVWLENARLRMADGMLDNLFKNSIARTDAAADAGNRQYDIHIYGTGGAVLDGGNHNGLVERNAAGSVAPAFACAPIVNSLIHFHNAERIVIENLQMVNARYWGMTFHFCSSVRISGIRFMTCGACPNNDGIDLRMGCNGFLIENVTGYTQDDTVALTCLDDRYAARVEGMDDSIHGVTIRNVASCSRCANVRLLTHYGRKLYNVLIDNVRSFVETEPGNEERFPLRLPDCERVAPAVEPVYWSTFENGARRAEVCVRIGENDYYDPKHPESASAIGDLYNVTVRNIVSNARIGVSMQRNACDVVIDNVQMFGKTACAVLLGRGEFENIRMNGLSFAASSVLTDSDAAPSKGDYGWEEPAAIVFHKDCRARGIFCRGLTTHPQEKRAVSGQCGQELTLNDVYLRGGAENE